MRCERVAERATERPCHERVAERVAERTCRERERVASACCRWSSVLSARPAVRQTLARERLPREARVASDGTPQAERARPVLRGGELERPCLSNIKSNVAEPLLGASPSKQPAVRGAPRYERREERLLEPERT